MGMFIISSVRAASSYGSLELGTEWTISFKESSASTAMDISFRVNAISGDTLTGDICEASVGSDISKFVWTQLFLTPNVQSLSTVQNVTYGGKTLTAYICTSISSYPILVVANDTGIILNITAAGDSYSYTLVSWTYQGGGVPGYELPMILGITAIFTIGIIYYIHKKQIQLKLLKSFFFIY